MAKDIESPPEPFKLHDEVVESFTERIREIGNLKAANVTDIAGLISRVFRLGRHEEHINALMLQMDRMVIAKKLVNALEALGHGESQGTCVHEPCAACDAISEYEASVTAL